MKELHYIGQGCIFWRICINLNMDTDEFTFI